MNKYLDKNLKRGNSGSHLVGQVFFLWTHAPNSDSCCILLFINLIVLNKLNFMGKNLCASSRLGSSTEMNPFLRVS